MTSQRGQLRRHPALGMRHTLPTAVTLDQTSGVGQTRVPAKHNGPWMIEKSQGHLPLGVEAVAFLGLLPKRAVESLGFISSHFCREHRVRQHQ